MLPDRAIELSADECFTVTKAIENLQTVPDELYKQCEECLQTSLASHRGRAVTESPQKLLKAMSSMTSASSFSLVGSSMLDAHSDESIESNASRMDSPQNLKRGWDWRSGLAQGTKGKEVLRMLRLSLARKIASHWMDSELE